MNRYILAFTLLITSQLPLLAQTEDINKLDANGNLRCVNSGHKT
jgi:hypothetical protein